MKCDSPRVFGVTMRLRAAGLLGACTTREMSESDAEVGDSAVPTRDAGELPLPDSGTSATSDAARDATLADGRLRLEYLF